MFFCSTLKGFFVLQIFTIFSGLFGYREKATSLIQNVMTSQTGQQICNYKTHFAQHLKKGNQAMKFGQLIEYNVKNIFLQKSCRK